MQKKIEKYIDERIKEWSPDLEPCPFSEIVEFLSGANDISLDDYVASGDEYYRHPWFSWEITSYCQYRCTYCYAWEMLTDKFDRKLMDVYPKVLKTLQLKNCPEFHIELLGGEPSTHPGIFDILDGLQNNDKCLSIELITNLARPMSFFEKLNDHNYSKLIVAASYHHEYDNDNGKKFIEKSLAIDKLDNIGFYFGNVNFDKHEDSWDKSLNIVSALGNAGIGNHFNLIHSTQKYQGFDFGYDYKTSEGFDNNHEDMKVTTLKFLDYCLKWQEKDPDAFKHTYQRTVKYTHKKTGEILKLPELIVRLCKMDRFKGWECHAKMYTIDLKGDIRHDCTYREVDMLFKNIHDCVICPMKEGCQCDIMLSYPKNR